MTYTTFQELLLTPFNLHEILGFEILSSEKHFCHWEISESLLLVRGLDPCKILLISFWRPGGSGPPLKSKDTQFAAVKLPKCLLYSICRLDLYHSHRTILLFYCAWVIRGRYVLICSGRDRYPLDFVRLIVTWSSPHDQRITPVAGLIFETKNPRV